MICRIDCLLIISGVDDFATVGTFGPHARFTASRLIVNDRVSISNCLATERAGTTDCLWVIESHSHDIGSSGGEGACDTLFELVRSVRLTQLCSLASKLETL